jgi:PucR C-terminal helix-turn-helix domain/GGDEF-like domain
MRRASDELPATAALAVRLRSRREEIEQAISTRALALSRPAEESGPEYLEGLHAAVSAGVELGVAAIGRGEAALPPVPATMLEQARLAARSGVGLDTVLRRYLAGHAMLGDFVVEEAEGEVPSLVLKRLLRRLAATTDRVLADVTAAYNEEADASGRGHGRRCVELTERLLAGEPLDASELGYDLDAHHLGLLAAGPEAAESLRELARSLDARLLSVEREGGVLWAWLGRHEPLECEDVRRFAAATLAPRSTIALGEPGEGRSGWRLTHRQALAAFPVASRSDRALVRYADVALLASILQDDLLSTSLRRLYLERLETERDGGAALFKTLRAYFGSGRSVSSAALVLGVSRNTVSNRLRTVEQRLARPLSTCGLDLDAALKLESIE